MFDTTFQNELIRVDSRVTSNEAEALDLASHVDRFEAPVVRDLDVSGSSDASHLLGVRCTR